MSNATCFESDLIQSAINEFRGVGQILNDGKMILVIRVHGMIRLCHGGKFCPGTERATMAKSVLASLLFVHFIAGAACAKKAADPSSFFQPFSIDSPWNKPLGSGAVYQEVSGIDTITLCMNYDDRWTSALYFANTTDRIGNLYFSNDTWLLLDQGIPNIGNSADMEDWLRKHSSTEPLYPANQYSTVVPGSPDPVWPPDYHKVTDPYYSRSFYIPEGVRPSPDTDGFISIHQPNGWVLDAYSAIVLSNGDIVCMMAGYVDSKGSGTGWSNGRRASMLPSFAGIIRNGEISTGKIRHALAGMISPTLLKEEAQWPAVAFDMNAGYSGSLPMGALLAIPPEINVDRLGLTSKGNVLARALQDFGMYVVDRCGSGGLIIMADLNAKDIRWKGSAKDFQIIKHHLRWVANNSEANP